MKCVAGIQPYYYDMVMADNQPMAFGMGMAKSEMPERSSSSTSEPQTRVRKLFPETWLWLNKTTGYVNITMRCNKYPM